MHNDFALNALNEVLFFPGKIVMVFDVEQDLGAEIRGNVLMNQRMVGGGIFPHEFHGAPIFLALRRVEREPGQPLELAGQIGELAESNPAVMVAHSRPRPATATMAEQGDVRAGLEVIDFAVRSKKSEFNKMIAAAAGA